MDFHNYTTTREACKRSGAIEDPDEFYRAAFEGAVQMDSAQFYGQLHVEREWEQTKKPYYSVWPGIVPMLTRLNLDLDLSAQTYSETGKNALHGVHHVLVMSARGFETTEKDSPLTTVSAPHLVCLYVLDSGTNSLVIGYSSRECEEG